MGYGGVFGDFFFLPAEKCFLFSIFNGTENGDEKA